MHRYSLQVTRFTKMFIIMGITTLGLMGCAGKTNFKSACVAELDAAWDELSIANTQGFSGSVSYTKALSLITAAKTMQTVENFDNCYNNAKKARFYIQESKSGR